MNIVKNGNCFLMAHWKTIYENRQEVRIRKLIKGLFDYGGWSGLHIALWTWLSLDGKREKDDWFEKFGVPEVNHYCFACEEASTINAKRICSACPLERDKDGQCANGLYEAWVFSHKLAERESLAREIANMKWVTK